MQMGYLDLIKWLKTEGDVVAPRGQSTREIRGAQFCLLDPTRALPVGIGRKLNLRFAAEEAFQLIAGYSDPATLVSANPNMVQFMDGGAFHGAYGPRIRPQLDMVARRLTMDRDTRQAVMTIWDPLRDSDDHVRDLPCTVMLHFMIRHRRLELHTVMRSNDVWWGVAYDVFNFTQLQLFMAECLGVECGPYYHMASSLHLYERDIAAAEQLSGTFTLADPITGLGYGGRPSSVQRWLRDEFRTGNLHEANYTPTMKWYATKLGI